MCSSTTSEAEQPPAAAHPPLPSADQLVCQYSSWYPQFERHALRSRVIELPPEFVDFLLADGVHVGARSRALPAAARRPYRSDSSSSDEQEDEEDEQPDWPDLFPELFRAINQAVSELGGQVVPKLNWSCPTDAVWVNPGGCLACDNAEQVAAGCSALGCVLSNEMLSGYCFRVACTTDCVCTQVVLLLKSSDRAAHDLELLTAWGQRPGSLAQWDQDAAPPSLVPMLVLRKWYDLRPEREWRCFVRAGQLVAVSQRDPTQHYPQLCGAACSVDVQEHEEQQQEEERCGQLLPPLANGSVQQEISPGPHLDAPAGQARGGASGQRCRWQPQDVHPAAVAAGEEARRARDLLARFHEQHMRSQFNLLQHYTFDAYVTTGNVKLLDLNPVGGTTSPLLFEWHELGLGPDTPQEPAGSAGGGGSHDEGCSPAPQSGAVHASVSGQAGAHSVLLRVVPAASYVQAGHRAACAMPFDMLGLQDCVVDSMVSYMAQHER